MYVGVKVSAIAYRSLPSPSTTEGVLTAVHKVYNDYTEYLYFVRSIFLYLDRSYVLSHQSVGNNLHSSNADQPRARPLREVGIDSFRHHVTQEGTKAAVASSTFMDIVASANKGPAGNSVSVSDAVISSLLHLVERDRDGEIVDRLLLRDTVRMLSELNLYHSVFVPPLLDSSALYYGREGIRVMESGRGTAAEGSSDISGFLKHVETRLGQCHEACLEYLEGFDGGVGKKTSSVSSSVTGSEGAMPTSSYLGTRKALLNVVEDNLLKPHVGVILDPQNCFPLLRDKSRTVPDVRRMYLLLKRVGFTKDLKNTFYQYAQHDGLEIVQEKATSATATTSNSEKEVVPKLLKWKADLNLTLHNAFESQDQFQAAIRNALEAVLNLRGTKMSEWLAKYVDGVLRARGGKAGDAIGEDAEAALEEVMVLFRHLHSKDVFEAFYQKDLAKRLLHSKSSSVDLERAFLSKLKAECGTGYTSKMEGMFKDMDLSRDIMSQYSDYSREHKMAVSDLSGK
jgi:cullin-4